MSHFDLWEKTPSPARATKCNSLQHQKKMLAGGTRGPPAGMEQNGTKRNTGKRYYARAGSRPPAAGPPIPPPALGFRLPASAGR